MDKEKVLDTTRDLKLMFEKKKLLVSEARETIYRLLDYIDSHFEDSLEVPFKNGNGLNGNIYKDKKPIKGVKLEVMNGIRAKSARWDRGRRDIN